MATRCGSFLVMILLLEIMMILCLGLGSHAKTAVTARKEDVKYIKCGVCQALVKQLSRQVNKKREAVAPKKLTELEIIDLTENICDLKKEMADWILHLDIVEDGDQLKLVEQQEEGDCNTECKTIERACQEVMGDHDTDVAEFLFKGETGRSALSKLLCNDLSKACSKKPPAVPKDRAPGEHFSPKPKKDAEMAKLMRSMSDMPGAPGMQMYSRDQLLKSGMGMGLSDDDDDEDDEDDENDGKGHQVPEPIPGREPVQSGLLDQALRGLKSGVHKAVDSATYHLTKFSHRLSKWWSGNNDPSKQNSSKSTDKAKSSTTKSEL